VRRSLVRERMAPFSRLESLMAYTEDISASWLRQDLAKQPQLQRASHGSFRMLAFPPIKSSS
jgi:hypothetical protein